MRRIALTFALLSFSLATFAQESAPAPTPEAAATVAPAPEAATAAPTQPMVAKQPTLGTPVEGAGQVVFFRPWKFAGGGVNFKVREGDNELGMLAAGKYFIVDVPPGTHRYVVHSEAKDVLELEVEAGETYYVKGSITMGVLSGRPNISPSDQAEFASAQKKLKRTASEIDMAAQAARNRAGAATGAEGAGGNGS